MSEMLQVAPERQSGSVSINPGVRNEIDDADLESVSSIAPLDAQHGDAETKTNEDGSIVEKNGEAPAEGKKKEESAPSKTGDGETSKIDAVPPKSKDQVQKRIDELTRKRYDAERQAAGERTRRINLEVELQKLKVSTSSSEKPKVENFNTEAEYIEALVNYQTDVRVRQVRESAIAEAKTQSISTESGAEKTVVEAVIEKGRERYADFGDKVFNQSLVLSPELAKTVIAAERAEDILYYLASNPEESKLLSSMSGTRVAIEVGRIEERLLQPKPPTYKRTSNAPPPIKPLQATGVVDKDPSQMSSKEYRAWRERNKE